MILRAIQVEGWRCFADRVAVGPFSERLNVVFAPNGAGKSTLLGALAHGLLDSHAVSGQAVESLQPWGRDLYPRVLVEFEHAGRRYRVEKQFLGSPRSELSREEDGRFTRLAEGREADERVRNMLDAQPPARGLSDPRHWGLAQVLWVPQDGLALPALAGGVADQIRVALGAQLRDPLTEALQQSVDEAYSQIYTEKTGALKKIEGFSPIGRLENDLADARQRQRDLQEKLAAFETESQRIEDLRQRRDAWFGEEREATEQLKSARQRASEYQSLLMACEKHQDQLDKAKATHERLKKDDEEIHSLGERLRVDRQRRAELEAEAPLRAADVAACLATLNEAKTDIARLRQRREQIEADAQLAERAAGFQRDRQRLAEVERTWARLAEAQKDLDECLRRRDEAASLEPERLHQIEGESARCREARQRLEAAMVTATIQPERDMRVEVILGEDPGERPLASGKPLEIRGSPAVEFRLPGVGVIRAAGPVDQSLDVLRAELAESEARLASLTEGLPTADLPALRSLCEESQELARSANDARLRVETILEGRPAEALKQERERLAEAIAKTLAENPAWVESPPEVQSLAEIAGQARESLKADWRAADERAERAGEAYQGALRRQDLHEAATKTLAERIGETERELARQTANQDDQARKAELAEWAMAADAAEGYLKKAQEDLAQFAGDPLAEVQGLEETLRSLGGDLSDLQIALGQAEGRLSALVDEAPYSALAQVEETIESLTDEIARQRLDNEAIRLLHETIRQCRDEAVKAVLDPVQRQATQTLQRIVGGPLGEIRFDRSLAAEGIVPEGLAEPVGLGEFSGGEREQIHLAVRLALAETLSAGQRHLVVLDDVLTATDPIRLARILEILAETAERLQILVFTCHVERYRSLPKAAFFDLQA